MSLKKFANKKTYLTLMGIIVIILAVVFGTAFSKKDVIASVEGESITKDELYDVLVKQYGPSTLSYLIDNKIVEVASEKENITISDEEKDAEMQEYIEAVGGEDVFTSTLEMYGLTEEDIETDIVNYLKIVKLLQPKIEITDEEIKTYFEENKESFNTPEQVEASHILVEDEATATKVKEKIDAGQDFAQLAKEYSTDASNAENGGELGYFSKGTMVEEFEKAAFSMNKGDISDPIKTEYGYHIIHITDKKEAQEAVFEDHKEEIKKILLDEAVQSEYSNWITEQREQLNIENTLLK
jgi:foldase protein PrsA